MCETLIVYPIIIATMQAQQLEHYKHTQSNMGNSLKLSSLCKPAPHFIVKTATWSKDAQGLFDYEASRTTEAELSITGTCRITRKGTVVEIKNSGEDLDQTEGVANKCLAHIGLLNERYWLYNPTLDETRISPDQLWLVLRNYVSQNGERGIKLHPNDILKLGRRKYIVRELVGDSLFREEHQLADSRNLMLGHDVAMQEGDEVAEEFGATVSAELASAKEEVKGAAGPAKEEDNRCRICLGSESTEDNQLIHSPCKCSGSVGLIHANCMKQWLKSKVTERYTSYLLEYTWKKLVCDVCKADYPNVITCPNGRKVEIIQIQKPMTHYMILQTVNEPGAQSFSIYVIFLGKKDTLRIGRSHSNEIRISDISVSRLHAEIRRVKGEYYLCDMNSKFGTLALLRKPIQIKAGNSLSVQAGRTVMIFSDKKQFCCTCFQRKHNTPEEEEKEQQPPTIEELETVMRASRPVPEELVKVEVVDNPEAPPKADAGYLPPGVRPSVLVAEPQPNVL